jgi:hypothetical protein
LEEEERIKERNDEILKFIAGSIGKYLPESVVAPKPVNDGWLTNPKRAIWPGRG